MRLMGTSAQQQPTVKRVMVTRASVSPLFLTVTSATPRVSAVRALTPVVRRVPVCRQEEDGYTQGGGRRHIYQDGG